MKLNTVIRFGVAAALLLLIALVTPRPVHGQQVMAAITGRVVDPTGAPVPDAKITAVDVDRGSVFPTVTNSDGVYDLPNVPIGNYNLRVERQGFQSLLQSNVTLVLNQVARLDFQMKIGDVATSVNVTEAAPLLQTETTQVSTLLNSHEIENIPLETRNYNQLALLIPGSLTTSPGAFNTGLSTFNSGRPYINGNREQANYYPVSYTHLDVYKRQDLYTPIPYIVPMQLFAAHLASIKGLNADSPRTLSKITRTM